MSMLVTWTDESIERVNITEVHNLGHLWDVRDSRRDQGLKPLLKTAEHCEATDARDRVFALACLVNDLQAEIIRADYQRLDKHRV